MSIRCYLPPDAWKENPVRLTGGQAHHLTGVLRVRAGEAMTCLDGLGGQAEARIVQAGSRRILLQLGPRREDPAPPCSVSLGAGLPGQGRFDRMVGEATQMGAAEVIPIKTERSIVRISAREFERKAKRFQQIAVEALKQSGATRLPQIHPLTDWAELLGSFPDYDRVLMATPDGPHEPLSGALSGGPIRKALLLIGPEGDFSPKEVQEAVCAGARRIRLGPHIMRCETAAVAGLSLVTHLLTS